MGILSKDPNDPVYWNRAPYTYPGAQTSSYTPQPSVGAGQPLSQMQYHGPPQGSYAGAGQQSATGGSGLLASSIVPALIGMAGGYTGNRGLMGMAGLMGARRDKARAAAAEQQQIQGILSNHANPAAQAHAFMAQGMPEMARLALTTGAYPGEQDRAVRDQIMQEQKHGMDMRVMEAEDQARAREAARSMSETDRAIFEKSIKQFDPEVKPIKYVHNLARGVRDLMNEEGVGKVMGGGFEYTNPARDMALMTAYAKALRPNEAVMAGDQISIQMAASGDELLSQWLNTFTKTSKLQPRQRQQIYDIIINKGILAGEALNTYRDRTEENYRGTGGTGDISKALNSIYMPMGLPLSNED